MGSWSLFEIWAACVLVVTPISIFQVLHERREAAKAKEAQSAKQRLAAWGKPENKEQKESELEWLSSMSMPQHMVATRLLVAHVDELGEADRTFLEQVRALPYEGRCHHVSTRRSICNELLREINGDKADDESPEPLWKALLTVVCQSAGVTAFFIFGFKLLLMVAGGVSTMLHTQWDSEAWRQADLVQRGRLVHPLVNGDEAVKQEWSEWVSVPQYFNVAPIKGGEVTSGMLPEGSPLWKLVDKKGVIRELGEPDDERNWAEGEDSIGYFFDLPRTPDSYPSPDYVLILYFDRKTQALTNVVVEVNRRPPGIK